MINIKKGLDLPISGQPEQSIGACPVVKHVGIIGSDYPGLRPSMAVEVGSAVKKGQVLFEDKKNPGTRFTAPASGTVVAVNRGERRAFQSLVIEVDESVKGVEFKKTPADKLLELSLEDVKSELIESGMWTAIRTRPFDKVPHVNSLPHSIFITAMDTSPLAPEAGPLIAAEADAFVAGQAVLSRFGVKVFVCHDDKSIPLCKAPEIAEEIFVGPHPAGLAGTHIHFLDPVSENKTVWHINYQDVIAIGHLFTEGELYNKRVISIAGPNAKEPRLVKTILGASVAELSANEIIPSEYGVRVISGSVLWGNNAVGAFAYLGRYHSQVSIIEEGKMHDILFKGWLGLGLKRHSASNAYASSWFKPSEYIFNTSINGGSRPMVPVGQFEKVMPLDIEPTMLLRSIEINDVDQAKLLGILELSEEDVALCTYVCPGKTDYGRLIRRSLTKIELEG
ncbi:MULTISPECIES: Na(+)-translocating NADH-quinone reductase subunit A [unclassified Anaerobiospirillum]|uniref:Na(+)-translocating NADH-quinone reductase subunit A n=1 Tax=unclassified Anaerobiospirillum TaxID=2647410 RepID=UPI001FF12A34|nr:MULTISPECIES: Na(+)-translocating NADH-quinone reductase subunit A [unclassified Anaerobiospirillum]MCK0525770.1 Na(+)-translocating NADH-quinone reductase subunit A [Anaerobiospirillum sp. NML120449]MCK0534927.1 Na(+)-translocating NADH-quinone reductase subunit A [Anaerobiospirillum sp. NML120511]MCK0540368.1 Na(+)-translocating NADH-quinone reductase subunit A [Anaerobiospirillum sp. NML02-A-032]